MHKRPDVLVNTAEIELWPAHLLRARSNRHARCLAQNEWLLRRKRDGQFLAAASPASITSLVPNLRQETGATDALAALARTLSRTRDGDSTHLSAALTHSSHLRALGVDDDYSRSRDLPLVAEPRRLELAGFDRYRRPLWLFQPAMRAWKRLLGAATADGISLEPISGYRSVCYQRGIFDRKLARGHTIDEILAVNAAPGYSEHHSGCAIDISSSGEPAAEESFEGTEAFTWLAQRAGEFGFSMSYPRGNRHGVTYEPWHWRWWPSDER